MKQAAARTGPYTEAFPDRGLSWQQFAKSGKLVLKLAAVSICPIPIETHHDMHAPSRKTNALVLLRGQLKSFIHGNEAHWILG